MTGNDWPNPRLHRACSLAYAQDIRVNARSSLASVAAASGLVWSEQRQRVRAEERKGDLPSPPLEEGDRTGPELRGGTS